MGTVMDYIEAVIAKGDAVITMEEWCYIRRHGTPDEIEEAVERMEAAGGYENLK